MQSPATVRDLAKQETRMSPACASLKCACEPRSASTAGPDKQNRGGQGSLPACPAPPGLSRTAFLPAALPNQSGTFPVPCAASCIPLLCLLRASVRRSPVRQSGGNFHARISSPPLHHSATFDTSKPGAALTAV